MPLWYPQQDIKRIFESRAHYNVIFGSHSGCKSDFRLFRVLLIKNSRHIPSRFIYHSSLCGKLMYTFNFRELFLRQLLLVLQNVTYE